MHFYYSKKSKCLAEFGSYKLDKAHTHDDGELEWLMVGCCCLIVIRPGISSFGRQMDE